MKTRGKYSDDCRGFSVEHQRLAQCRGIAREMAVPESVRNYRNIGAPILLFLGQESSPACRRNSQYAKEIDGSPRPIHSLRLPLGNQTKCEGIETCHTLKRFALFLDLRVFRVRHQSAAGLGFEVELREVDNAPRL